MCSHTSYQAKKKSGLFPLMCTRAPFPHVGAHNMKIDVTAVLSDCFSVSDPRAMPLFLSSQLLRAHLLSVCLFADSPSIPSTLAGLIYFHP